VSAITSRRPSGAQDGLDILSSALVRHISAGSAGAGALTLTVSTRVSAP
jgi:hypothetical protein